ncbi:MAG: TRAP transporter small permease subunit [Rhodobacteraceae bacterium]|nr:TRAP transporter small permease subunit [Paracoccaceae bacterium]
MSAYQTNGTRLHGLVLRITTIWAILGGFILLAVVAVNTASVVRAIIVGKTLSGDFELTEVGVAIAAFSFLPYCQIAGHNVTADIFTARASRFWISIFSFLSALVALGFGSLLLWRTWLGMIDMATYNSTTTILQIPLSWGFGGCLMSLALLAVAAAVTAREEFFKIRRGRY